MKSGKIEEKLSEVIGLGVLQNGDFVKARKNKIQIISATSGKTLFDIDVTTSDDETYRFLMAELSNQRLAIIYSCYGESMFGVIDLKSGNFNSDLLDGNVDSLLSMPNGSLLFLSYSKIYIAFFEDNILEFRYIHQPHEGVSHPMILPEKERILFLASPFGDRDKPSLTLKLLDYQLEKQSEFKLNVSRPMNGELIALPNDKIAFLSGKNFLCIYDMSRSYLSKTRLTKSSSMDEAWYEKLLLLDDTYLVIWGPSYQGSNICIQIFDISKHAPIKVEQTMLKRCEFLASTPDGRLVSCTESGEIVLHNILPKSEEIKEATKSTLQIFPESVIEIIADYAGLFRKKSEKIKQAEPFEERRFSDPKRRCSIS